MRAAGKLQKQSCFTLFFHKNLHAKCYYNEERAIVGSMNMYEFSEKNNREMGILLSSYEDRDAFEEMVEEAESILNAAEEKSLSGSREVGESFSNRSSRENHNSDESGYCIRCRDRTIHNDPSRPFCPECYQSWAQWEDDSYIENNCHNCGKPGQTSMARPLCHFCYFGNPGL